MRQRAHSKNPEAERTYSQPNVSKREDWSAPVISAKCFGAKPPHSRNKNARAAEILKTNVVDLSGFMERQVSTARLAVP